MQKQAERQSAIRRSGGVRHSGEAVNARNSYAAGFSGSNLSYSFLTTA